VSDAKPRENRSGANKPRSPAESFQAKAGPVDQMLDAFENRRAANIQFVSTGSAESASR
jgi:hypothetical protein